MNHYFDRTTFSMSEESRWKLQRERMIPKRKQKKKSPLELDLESDLKRQVIERMLQNGLKSKLI